MLSLSGVMHQEGGAWNECKLTGAAHTAKNQVAKKQHYSASMRHPKSASNVSDTKVCVVPWVSMASVMNAGLTRSVW